MKRTAQSIEENKAKITAGSEKEKGKKDRRGHNPKSRKNLRPYPKGVSGNPSGLPGTDLSALAARRFFEAHPEIEDFELPKGFNAYAWNVLSERGYGKLKEKHEVDLNVNVAEILSRVRKRIANARKR
jgi:hypothetical protein